MYDQKCPYCFAGEEMEFFTKHEKKNLRTSLNIKYAFSNWKFGIDKR